MPSHGFCLFFFYFGTLVQTFFPMNLILVLTYVYKNLLVLKDYHEDCASWVTLLSPSAHTVNIYVLYITYHILSCTIVIYLYVSYFTTLQNPWKQQYIHRSFFPFSVPNYVLPYANYVLWEFAQGYPVYLFLSMIRAWKVSTIS